MLCNQGHGEAHALSRLADRRGCATGPFDRILYDCQTHAPTTDPTDVDDVAEKFELVTQFGSPDPDALLVHLAHGGGKRVVAARLLIRLVGGLNPGCVMNSHSAAHSLSKLAQVVGVRWHST